MNKITKALGFIAALSTANCTPTGKIEIEAEITNYERSRTYIDEFASRCKKILQDPNSNPIVPEDNILAGKFRKSKNHTEICKVKNGHEGYNTDPNETRIYVITDYYSFDYLYVAGNL